MPRHRLASILTALLAFTLALPALGGPAKLRGTKYTLTAPPGWKVTQPATGDMLLRAMAPGGVGFIEVYYGANALPLAKMISGYEQRMGRTLAGWRKMASRNERLAGGGCQYRRYVGSTQGIPLEIQAIFFTTGREQFIAQAVTTQSGHAALFDPGRQSILSLASSRPLPGPRRRAVEEKKPAPAPLPKMNLNLFQTLRTDDLDADMPFAEGQYVKQLDPVQQASVRRVYGRK